MHPSTELQLCATLYYKLYNIHCKNYEQKQTLPYSLWGEQSLLGHTNKDTYAAKCHQGIYYQQLMTVESNLIKKNQLTMGAEHNAISR